MNAKLTPRPASDRRAAAPSAPGEAAAMLPGPGRSWATFAVAAVGLGIALAAALATLRPDLWDEVATVGQPPAGALVVTFDAPAAIGRLEAVPGVTIVDAEPAIGAVLVEATAAGARRLARVPGIRIERPTTWHPSRSLSRPDDAAGTATTSPEAEITREEETRSSSRLPPEGPRQSTSGELELDQRRQGGLR